MVLVWGVIMKEQWWRLFEVDFDVMSYDLQRFLYDSFYRFAYKDIIFIIKDHALVEDIIQEAFLKSVAKRHQLNNTASGKQWVRRIIRNQMIDTMRSKKNRRWTSLHNAYSSAGHFDQEVAADIEGTVENMLRDQMLHESIMELKVEYRRVLLNYYIEEKSYREIASELGINEQTLAQRLARARKKLLRKFLCKWVDEDE
jgi:RNA polymerase sigma-70 factor (ECF subfamily)